MTVLLQFRLFLRRDRSPSVQSPGPLFSSVIPRVVFLQAAFRSVGLRACVECVWCHTESGDSYVTFAFVPVIYSGFTAPSARQARARFLLLRFHSSVKDLGMTVYNKLDFTKHVDKITSQAYSILGFTLGVRKRIQRCLYTYPSIQEREILKDMLQVARNQSKLKTQEILEGKNNHQNHQ
ncbi:hypothetical protein EVAR_69639_1, partial [Eumeta japonica]